MHQTDQKPDNRVRIGPAGKPLAVLLAALLLGMSLLSGCGGGQQPGGDVESEGASSRGGRASGDWPAREETGEILDFTNFSTWDLYGNAVDDSIFTDHAISMVNVWASWCGPCVNEMPDLGEIARKRSDEEFQLIGVITDASADELAAQGDALKSIRDLVEELDADYLHLLASDHIIEGVLDAHQVVYIPTTFFVTDGGRIVGDVYTGSKTRAQWEAIIDSVLEQYESGAFE